MFEDLVSLELPESEIFQLARKESLRHRLTLSNDVTYYLELVPKKNPISLVKGVMVFKTSNAARDFAYGGKFMPRGIFMKVNNGLLKMYFGGGYSLASFEYDGKDIKRDDFHRYEHEYTPFGTIPWEVVNRGFGEIKKLVADSKKAV